MSAIDDSSALRVLALLNRQGEARFVGGCVRDFLLGRPLRDIDIATTLVPNEVMQLLSENGMRVIPTGVQHGTVTAVIEQDSYEITTLRNDVATDGRHAEVAFTDSWQEDAARRDFTMNAMSMDAEGTIYDYYDGQVAVAAGLVQFVGDAAQRVAEDYLRMLRLFRFQAYYGREALSEEVLAVCRQNLAGIDQLSGERLQYEMMRLLAADAVYEVLVAMNQCGLLAKMLLASEPLKLDAQKRLEGLEEGAVSAFLRLSILLRGNGLAGQLPLIRSHWKLSNHNNRYMEQLLDVPLLPANTPLDVQKELLRKLGQDIYGKHVLQSWALADDVDGKSVVKYRMMLEFVQGWQVPEFPLAGKDLLAVGVPAGKEMGDLLAQAEAVWVAGDYQAGKAELLLALGFAG